MDPEDWPCQRRALVTNLNARTYPDPAIIVPYRFAADPIERGGVDRLRLAIDGRRCVITRAARRGTEDGAGDQTANQACAEHVARVGLVRCADTRRDQDDREKANLQLPSHQTIQ